jgi:hypothetical protein
VECQRFDFLSRISMEIRTIILGISENFAAVEKLKVE